MKTKITYAKIQIDKNYSDKWNNSSNDFIVLVKDDKILRNTLYRFGGLSYPEDIKKDYFMLLKYIEESYPDNITKDKKKKLHLAGHWCILDKYGNEKIVFEEFKHPYLTKNSCIYSCNNEYYNIETNECYGSSYSSIESSEFLFLDNKYDKDEKKRGVMKINKKDGTFEIFS